MEKFEKYHPIMSKNYTFDWLNSFTMKDVFRLRNDEKIIKHPDTTIEDSIFFVSHAMRSIMANEALVYGIQTRKTMEFVGIFSITDFSNSSAKVSLQSFPEQHADIIEIYERMFNFLFNELQLSQVFSSDPVLRADKWSNNLFLTESVSTDLVSIKLSI